MKQRLLIVEPSEVIVEGLKAILDGQVRFKLLEPEMSVDHLTERLVATRPDILLVNPTLVDNVAKLRGEQQDPTGVVDIQGDAKLPAVRKVMRDGRVLIMRDGVTYDVWGHIVAQ